MKSVLGRASMFIIGILLLSGCALSGKDSAVKSFESDPVSAETQNTPQGQLRQETKEQMRNRSIGSEYVVDQSDFVDAKKLTDGIVLGMVSDAEREGLILMREEEKLARDVYQTLSEKWGAKIFSNIAQSEQTHTDAVKVLLDRYAIADPVVTDERGVFTSAKLQQLYADLVAEGSVSLRDALTVGATVEDLDISDLNALMAQTQNENILRVYESLARGSRNHMRAFIRQLERAGSSYTARYITQRQMDDILATPQERENGSGGGQRGGKNR